MWLRQALWDNQTERVKYLTRATFHNNKVSRTFAVYMKQIVNNVRYKNTRRFKDVTFYCMQFIE